LNAGRKAVFSRSLRTAKWANTTIAAGDTTKRSTSSARRRRPHHGLGRRQFLAVAHAARLDRCPPGLVPLRCGRGYPAVHDDAPKSYRLDLVSSTAFSNGIVGCSTAGTASPAARRYARRL
jgi:hypothetical protein